MSRDPLTPHAVREHLLERADLICHRIADLAETASKRPKGWTAADDEQLDVLLGHLVELREREIAFAAFAGHAFPTESSLPMPYVASPLLEPDPDLEELVAEAIGGAA